MFKRSVAAILLVTAMACTGHTAELKLLGPVSLRVVLPSQLQQFGTSSGHNVTVGYDTLGSITRRITEGEAVDVAMVSPAQIEDLEKRGKLLADNGAEIARVGFTVFVKKGAPGPDLSSVDALKRALLAANSIVLGDPAAGGGAGVFTAGLMQRLGVESDIKSRTRLVRSGTEVAETVAKGEAEMGIGVASDAAIVPDIETIALPSPVQSYSVYVAGISAGSTQVDAARDLIAFLTSPSVKQALTAGGFETP